jgi:hypothetical protein
MQQCQSSLSGAVASDKLPGTARSAHHKADMLNALRMSAVGVKADIDQPLTNLDPSCHEGDVSSAGLIGSSKLAVIGHRSSTRATHGQGNGHE